MIKFKERLKELRLEKELSQDELAKALKINQRSISNWETGVRQPDYETLVLIAEYFSVTTDYLLGISD